MAACQLKVNIPMLPHISMHKPGVANDVAVSGLTSGRGCGHREHTKTVIFYTFTDYDPYNFSSALVANASARITHAISCVIRSKHSTSTHLLNSQLESCTQTAVCQSLLHNQVLTFCVGNQSQRELSTLLSPLASHLFPPYSPAIYVYKVCHFSFVSVNFTDEGPELGRNI